jgi:type IV pilus assembly protein PilM
MLSAFSNHLRTLFAPPHSIAPSLAGIDLSTSGVKAVRLRESPYGIILEQSAEESLSLGDFVDGEVVNRAAIVSAVVQAAKRARTPSANVALSESKGYLFETSVPGVTKAEWLVGVEQHLDELIPLPREEAVFDIVGVGSVAGEGETVVGVGFARRIIDETLAVFDEAKIRVRGLEEETFSMARALIPYGDTSTILIIDIGKTTTKLSIVSEGVPRFSTTIGVGGHALTLAVQKHFRVTEAEAWKIKEERGIVPMPGNEEYLEVLFSTVSVIRDEISIRLQYWKEHAVSKDPRRAVSRAILSGGNASLRGLPEYLQSTLRIPVVAGDVFTNFAPRDLWKTHLSHAESLAYATAIGLALREHTPYE